MHLRAMPRRHGKMASHRHPHGRAAAGHGRERAPGAGESFEGQTRRPHTALWQHLVLQAADAHQRELGPGEEGEEGWAPWRHPFRRVDFATLLRSQAGLANRKKSRANTNMDSMPQKIQVVLRPAPESSPHTRTPQRAHTKG